MTFVLGFVAGVATLALKAALDFYFERRRERRAVRAAARLVGHELGSASIWLQTVAGAGRWMTPEGWAFDHDVWRENKTLLAMALTDARWLTMATGYREVQLAESNMRTAVRDAGVGEPPLTPDMPQLIASGITGIDRAARVLDDLSSWPGREAKRRLRELRRAD